MSKIHSKRLIEVSALFPPESAGSDMIIDIPVFDQHARAGEVKEELLEHARDFKTVNYIYLVNHKGEMRGVVSMRELLQADEDAEMRKIMTKHVVVVTPLDTIPKVALLALKNNVKMLPIVDAQNRLLGAFGADQLLEILYKEFSNDLLRLSGVRVPNKHFAFDSMKVVLSRFPWMLIGMVGSLVTGSIIGVFKSSIEAVVLLAVFIPVIMSTGATSANQSAMIFLRNLIHGDIKNRIKYVFNEVKVSSTLGLALGVLLFSMLSIYPGDPALAFAVSVSLFCTIVVGGLIGVFIPMILNNLKMDPSTGAGPFLTIIKDLASMAIYFTIATALLSYFHTL